MISLNSSKLVGDGAVKTTALTELRREHTDAAAVADQIDAVEQVDDVEPQRRRLGIAGQQELARDTDIELALRRHRADIGIAVAQARAVDHVGGEPRAAP